jgi:hypothetical protein
MWCWAATTVGVLHYYGNDAVTQADVANYQTNRDDCDTGDEFNWLLEDGETRHPCNVGRYTTFIQDNLLHWGTNADYINRHLELSEISEEINAGRPFTIRYDWKNEDGTLNDAAHHVIGRGLVGNMVHIMDPSPSIGYEIRTYESTVESPAHVWSCGLKTNLEFKDNWDETITDKGTGNMWQRITGYDSDPDSSTRYSHGNAQSYCENLSFAGYPDWRLPKIDQLQRLAVQPNSPAIQPLFNNHTLPDKYWSDTTPTIGFRSYMNFEDGSTGWGAPSAEHYVRCVRTGQYGSLNVEIYPEEVRSDAGWSRSPLQEPFPHDTREYWIPVGNHSIQFTPVPGYETPVPINIIIANNIMHTLQVTYAGPFSYPLVTTLDAIDITNNFARLRSEINPQGSQTQAWFAYAVQSSSPAWQYTTKINIGSGTETEYFNPTLSNLECNTSYIFQARAENAGGTAHGEQKTFTTEACLPPSPSVTTLDAGKITQSSAILRGIVNPEGAYTEAWFQYREQAIFIYKWRSTSEEIIDFGDPFGETDVYIYHNVQDLQCGTTYEFRAVADNIGGTSYGDLKTFTADECSIPGEPSVTTLEATNISHSSATLQGLVNPEGQSTLAWFRYWPELFPKLWKETEKESIGTGSNDVHVSHTISELPCGENFVFRAAAENSSGTGYGDLETFTTAACPTYYNLSVNSQGAQEVPIKSKTGHDGTTDYTITDLEPKTQVHLQAPGFLESGPERKIFSNWSGCVSSTSNSISIVMDADKTCTVTYIDEDVEERPKVLPGVLMLLLDDEDPGPPQPPTVPEIE